MYSVLQTIPHSVPPAPFWGERGFSGEIQTPVHSCGCWVGPAGKPSVPMSSCPMGELITCSETVWPNRREGRWGGKVERREGKSEKGRTRARRWGTGTGLHGRAGADAQDTPESGSGLREVGLEKRKWGSVTTESLSCPLCYLSRVICVLYSNETR